MFRLCWKSQPRHQKGLCNQGAFWAADSRSGVIQGTVCLEAISRKRRNVDFSCLRMAKQNRFVRGVVRQAAGLIQVGEENTVLGILMRNCIGDTKLLVTTVIIDRATYLHLKNSGMMLKHSDAGCSDFHPVAVHLFIRNYLLNVNEFQS